MSISLAVGSVTTTAAETVDLSTMFTAAPTQASPKYLILSAIDRNEYTVGFTPAEMGTISGNGTSTPFTTFSGGGDGYSVGIAFTLTDVGGVWTYTSSTYGAFNNLTFTSSSFTTDNVNFSLFTSSSTTFENYGGNDYTNNPYILSLYQSLLQETYIGSVNAVTQPAVVGSTPAAATPDSIVAAAQTFVGQAWNDNGCWTLASNIAAEAGCSLPVVTALAGVGGTPNGEWIVAYDGSVSSSANWQASLKAGEMVAFWDVNSGGTITNGHITTVVSGAGTSTGLIDNITYVNGSGTIVNLAGDGSTNDVIVAAPHAGSQEFNTLNAADVVVYELDTPTVVAAVTLQSVGVNSSDSLGNLFTATNPVATQSISEFQVYDSNLNDSLQVNGSVVTTARAAATAATVSSLANAALLTGAVAGTDTVDVRAFNGSYWGDWTALAFSVTQGVSCFITGTRIATPAGEVPVESLRAGMAVSLAGGGAARVRWVGWHTVARRFADPVRTWPIRIRAGTLGEGLPRRDLLLSPCHALFLGGVLAEARTLLNGAGIARDRPAADSFAYWHIELDTHALLLAEGVAVESFIEEAEEFRFDNHATRPGPADACEMLPYPRCKSPRQLPRALRARVTERRVA